MTTAGIKVQSSGRLHMGFFDLHGGLGRKFGSIGLSLSEPGLVIDAQVAKTLNVTGEASVTASIISKVSSIAQQLVVELNLAKSVAINIKHHIPEHAGLGSGTQMALATGVAISRLYALNLSTARIAALTGRGGRSGIGMAAFNYGGLLIDGGRISGATSSSLATSKAPPLLARYDFPKDWSILLIFDVSQPGIHGDPERIAFDRLPVFSESLAAHLCRHVLMQAMPALVERDLTAFGQSIQVLQTHVGDYFAPVQGGRYASKWVGAALQYLEGVGVTCFGQSSWGPTGFAVFESADVAEKHLQQLKIKFADQALTWKICSANNHGAELILTS